MLWLVALCIAMVFVQPAASANGAMKIEDPIRPGSTRTIVHLQVEPAPVSYKQTERGSVDLDHVKTPPVHSTQACELSDTICHDLKTRFCGHPVTDESRGGRTFNPCAPARAGPAL